MVLPPLEVAHGGLLLLLLGCDVMLIGLGVYLGGGFYLQPFGWLRMFCSFFYWPHWRRIVTSCLLCHRRRCIQRQRSFGWWVDLFGAGHGVSAMFGWQRLCLFAWLQHCPCLLVGSRYFCLSVSLSAVNLAATFGLAPRWVGDAL